MKVSCKYIVALTLSLLISGCGDSSPKPDHDKDINPDVVIPGEPYIILIGDSIAEGHPLLHGRLHPNNGVAYDPDYKSEPGQLSYEFSQHFQVPVINHGIGGNTTKMVRERWARDVLHQSYDPGDGRGDKTMDFEGQIPYAVYLHVGINDVNQEVPIDEIKNNFVFFAESAKDNNIKLIIDNVGAYRSYTVEKETVARELNGWLYGQYFSMYPEVELIDYLGWSNGFSGDYWTLNPGKFHDTVHPNKVGYTDFALFVSKQITTKFK